MSGNTLPPCFVPCFSWPLCLPLSLSLSLALSLPVLSLVAFLQSATVHCEALSFSICLHVYDYYMTTSVRVSAHAFVRVFLFSILA